MASFSKACGDLLNGMVGAIRMDFGKDGGSVNRLQYRFNFWKVVGSWEFLKQFGYRFCTPDSVGKPSSHLA